jgi:hypothetical protein
MDLIPIQNDKSLYRDSNSGAVVNCSTSEFEVYLQQKNEQLQKNLEMENLKSDVSELKDMMKLILLKLDSNS